MHILKPGSLVLHKNRPARVLRTGDRLEIVFEDGEVVRVRLKDILLLHPGPLASFKELIPLSGDVHTAWEILSGERTTLAELAELIYGSFSPASAWAAWQHVSDHLYFSGIPEDIRVHSAEEVEHKQIIRARAEAERAAWKGLIERVRSGIYSPSDRGYFVDVENLAFGRSSICQLLVEAGRDETPESAHSLLLDLGIWDTFVNPHPVRQGVALSQVDLPVPDVPEEERLDLTHLKSFAIDDAGTDTPDDALSLDGDRLWVHIADASALVQPGDPIDLEAQSRGMSLHLPEGVVHLLPREVTLRLGLGLQEISPALSFGFRFDAQGVPGDFKIVPSWVRVQRLSYCQAEPLVDEEPLCTMYKFLCAVREQRRANRAVMLEFPEAKLEVIGKRVEIQPVLPLRSRVLVEEAIILTGAETARFAKQTDIPLPFSRQDEVEIAARPETLSEMFALRRFLKRSQYESSPFPHHSLGVPAYSQVTSPLRRYLDLVAHQQLRAALKNQVCLGREEVNGRIAAFESVAGHVRRAELLSERHWTMVYLLQHPGWRGEGILVEKRGTIGTLILRDLALEIRVHLKQDLPLDQVVPVLLTRVDLARQEADFRVISD